jgi:hypothetical protein
MPVRARHLNEKKVQRLTMFKCSTIAILIIIGVNIPYFSVVALFLACWFIFSGSVTEITNMLLFTLAFSVIFKFQPGGNTFFNVLILAAIIKLLFFRRNIRFLYKEIILLVLFVSYVLAFGGANSIVNLINLGMYFVLMLLVFKQNEKIDLRSILLYFSIGIIFASFIGLFSEYIPGLSSYMNLSRIKLGPEEYINRFSGIQSNPNSFTMGISIALSGWFGLIIGKRAKPYDYIFIIILSVFGIMSLSKSFLVMYAVLFLLVITSFGKKNIFNLFKGVFIGGIIIAAIFVFVDQSYIYAFLSRLSSDSSSNASLSSVTTGRYDLWGSYLRYIFSNLRILLLGEGVGAEYYNLRPSHNYILEIIYYLGILGAILYLLCIKIIFPKPNPTVKRTLVNYFPFIILLVRGMAINLFMSENLIFYYILIAVMLNTNLQPKNMRIIVSQSSDKAAV